VGGMPGNATIDGGVYEIYEYSVKFTVLCQ